MLFIFKTIYEIKYPALHIKKGPGRLVVPLAFLHTYKHKCFIPVLPFVLMVSLLFLSSLTFADPAGTSAIITVKELNVRSKPHLGAPILKVLIKGEKIELQKQQDGWTQIVHEGQTGYIQTQNKTVFTRLKVTKQVVNQKTNKLQINQFKKEAKKINQKIKKRKAEIQSIKQKERSILTNLNETDLSLNKSKKLASLIKTDLAILSREITATRNSTKALELKIESSEQYTAKRLVALYKLQWLGKMHMLASAESMDELLQRKVYLERVLAYDRQTINQLIKNKNQHTNLLKKLKAQQHEKLSLEKDFISQISVSTNRKKEKKKLLTDIRSKKSLQIASIKALQKAAENLDQTIDLLSKQIESTGTTANITGKSFSTFKGLLKMPVKGKIVTKFGTYKNKELNVMNYRNGIDIAADKGEPIRAVRAGYVLFASWFKGYGNMIILDHGNRYYTLYAHAEELFKKKGEAVESQEVIAVVGDTGSMIGPELYFEIRHQGKPVNPLKWLKIR